MTQTTNFGYDRRCYHSYERSDDKKFALVELLRPQYFFHIWRERERGRVRSLWLGNDRYEKECGRVLDDDQRNQVHISISGKRYNIPESVSEAKAILAVQRIQGATD